MEQKEADRKIYGGYSLFGVPYSSIDIEYASERLYETYTGGGKGIREAMAAILDANEKVVSRCGMLISFSSTLMAILLFIANKPEMLPNLWQQVSYYAAMFLWMSFTMWLLYSLHHQFPPTWEFHTKRDFMITSNLYLRRMGIYNLTLIATIVSFIAIVLVLSPVSAVISDKLFQTAKPHTEEIAPH
jgi:hypothetical protein